MFCLHIAVPSRIVPCAFALRRVIAPLDGPVGEDLLVLALQKFVTRGAEPVA